MSIPSAMVNIKEENNKRIHMVGVYKVQSEIIKVGLTENTISNKLNIPGNTVEMINVWLILGKLIILITLPANN